MTAAAPFVRWVGGSQRTVDALLARCPADVAERRYVDPFLGGGALFWALRPRRAMLSDACAPLMAAWRARAAAYNDALERWRATCDELRSVQRVKVARALGRLVEAGLLEKLAPPLLSPEFRRAVEERGAPAALRRFHPAWPGKVVNDAEDLQLRLIARAGSGNSSTRAVLGSKAPSGTVLRAYSELVRWGVLIAPQQRTATAAGVALIAPQPLSVVA